MLFRSAEPIFTISVDSDGKVTLTQNAELDHGAPGSATDTILELANGLVELEASATITDDDGDSKTDKAKIDLGGNIKFEDDVPTIDITTKPGNVLLEESFELGKNSWTTGNKSWAVNGKNGDVTGDHGAVWKFNNNAGVEIQSGVVSDSDDGTAHAELDPHTKGTNASMSTEVSLTSSKEYTLEFAYQARAYKGSKETADMKVTFDGKELIIDSDANGNLTVTTNPNDGSVQYSVSTISADGWTTFTIVYKGVTGDSNNKATLSFEGLGKAETYGALLDDIKLVDTPKLIVDETDLLIDAKADYSVLFTASSDAGADGEKSYDTVYTLEVGNVNSGLVDTATGDNVLLKVDNGVVVGYVVIGGVETVVFELSVDSNGVITLDQQRSVIHPDSTNHDDGVSILDSNTIKLTRKDTITDGDNDTAMDSETIGIATTLTFKDDGPSITEGASGTDVNLTVDETSLNVNDTANFAGNFKALTIDGGADGIDSANTSTSYSLAVKTAGAESGLVDTATGEKVLLKVDNGVVVGYVTINNVETQVFTVSVSSSGEVTLDQKRAVSHPDSSNHDDSVSLSADDLVTLTRDVVVTDNDGDKATNSETLNIGNNLTFKDDGPTVDINKVSGTEPTITVDETLLTLDRTVDFSSMFTLVSKDAGEDGEQSHTTEYILNIKSPNVDSGLVHTGTNEVVLLSKNSSGVIEGKTASGVLVFTLFVDSSGKITLDQKEEVKHPQTTNHNDTVSLSADDLITLTRKDTIVDKDGDKDIDTATLNIGKNLKFKDDGISITANSKMVDEDALVGGSPDADSHDPDVKEVTGKLTIDAGEDGLQSLEFVPQSTVTASNVSGNLTSEGEEIVVSTDGPHKLIGTAHGETIFEITLDPNTQTYTFKLIGNIDHPTMNVEDLIENISFTVKEIGRASCRERVYAPV